MLCVSVCGSPGQKRSKINTKEREGTWCSRTGKLHKKMKQKHDWEKERKGSVKLALLTEYIKKNGYDKKQVLRCRVGSDMYNFESKEEKFKLDNGRQERGRSIQREDRHTQIDR